MYLAIDIVKSVGDDIRVRIAVKSLLLTLRSFLLFAYWNQALVEWIDSNDPDVTDAKYNEFLLRVLSGSNMMIGIVCIIILIILSLRYEAGYKKLHPLISRILGCCLLSGVASSILIYYVGIAIVGGANTGVLWPAEVQQSLYYAVAAVLIVYDLQYL